MRWRTGQFGPTQTPRGRAGRASAQRAAPDTTRPLRHRGTELGLPPPTFCDRSCLNELSHAETQAHTPADSATGARHWSQTPSLSGPSHWAPPTAEAGAGGRPPRPSGHRRRWHSGPGTEGRPGGMPGRRAVQRQLSPSRVSAPSRLSSGRSTERPGCQDAATTSKASAHTALTRLCAYKVRTSRAENRAQSSGCQRGSARSRCCPPPTWPPPPYLGQQQDALLQPAGQGLVRLALLPLLQQLGADLAQLLLQLLPHLVQLAGAAQRGCEGRVSPGGTVPGRAPAPPHPGLVRSQNTVARAAPRAASAL